MSSFDGKVVIVSGAASGLGLSIAKALSSRGATLALTDLNAKALDAAVAEFPADRTLGIPCDATKADDVESAVARTVQKFGRLDMAANNAGGTKPFCQLADETEAAYDFIFDLNVRSIFLGMKYQIQQMVRQGTGGTIVNLSSVCSVQNFFRGEGLYVGAKHAVTGLTIAAAFEYADQGIRVNAIAPGPCETPNKDGASPERARLLRDVLPMGRLGLGSEIAEGACWLLGAESAFVTGHVLRMDGGYLVRGASNEVVAR